MCAEAPVRGNATMRDIVPTHGNATTLDSMLAENMIGAGVIPGPLPYCDRSIPLWLGFGPSSQVGSASESAGGSPGWFPFIRRDCAASSQSRKAGFAFARRWRRVFLSGSADYWAPEASGPSGFQLLGT